MSNPSEATHIVGHAARRGMGARPGLQRASATVWAAFLGAIAVTAALMLMPEEWLAVPMSFERLAIIFGSAFILSMIPAVSVCILLSPRPAPLIDSVEIKHGR